MSLLRGRVRTPPVPPTELRFMGETPEGYLAIGDSIVDQLERWASLSERRRVLDVGCGYGRVAHALLRHGYSGRYLGLDILPRHVRWCQQNLSSWRWRFRHLDIENARYNPRGKLRAEELRLTRYCRAADLVVASSLFTHLDAASVRHYLREFAAVLEPGGVIFATFFCLAPDHERIVAEGERVMAFPHELSGGGRYEYEDEPLHAVGYEEGWLGSLFDDLGLEARHARAGSWRSGDERDPYQDVYVLARSEDRSDGRRQTP